VEGSAGRQWRVGSLREHGQVYTGSTWFAEKPVGL
jgi:hypothetical protein